MFFIDIKNNCKKIKIIGCNAPKIWYEKFKDLLNQKVIEITNWVPDVYREMATCEIFAAPIISGGGFRMKVCKAFALKMPVVATRLACEGMECIDGKHAYISDDSRIFAKRLNELLLDSSLDFLTLANHCPLLSFSTFLGAEAQESNL